MAKIGYLVFAAALLACLAMRAPARSADWSLRLGMSPGGSSPPEVIDMRWAHPYLDANATGASNATPEE